MATPLESILQDINSQIEYLRNVQVLLFKIGSRQPAQLRGLGVNWLGLCIVAFWCRKLEWKRVPARINGLGAPGY